MSVGGVVLWSDALARALLLAMEQDNKKKRKTKKTLGVRMDVLAPQPKGLRAKAPKVIEKTTFPTQLEQSNCHNQIPLQCRTYSLKILVAGPHNTVLSTRIIPHSALNSV